MVLLGLTTAQEAQDLQTDIAVLPSVGNVHVRRSLLDLATVIVNGFVLQDVPLRSLDVRDLRNLRFGLGFDLKIPAIERGECDIPRKLEMIKRFEAFTVWREPGPGFARRGRGIGHHTGLRAHQMHPVCGTSRGVLLGDHDFGWTLLLVTIPRDGHGHGRHELRRERDRHLGRGDLDIPSAGGDEEGNDEGEDKNDDCAHFVLRCPKVIPGNSPASTKPTL